jgi:hypothetical protein
MSKSKDVNQSKWSSGDHGSKSTPLYCIQPVQQFVSNSWRARPVERNALFFAQPRDEQRIISDRMHSGLSRADRKGGRTTGR